MGCASGYVLISCILLHQLQPRDMMAPITRGMPNDRFNIENEDVSND